MSQLEFSSKSFFLLSEVARLLSEGHQYGHELKYRISQARGYTIHITIDPPSVNEQSARQADESV